MADPWLSAAQRHDAQWVELDQQLSAGCEAALAEMLAKLWRLVLGERVPTVTDGLTAAAMPPNLDGTEAAARETWQQALLRWVRPILFAHYARQYGPNPPVAARDAWWGQTSARLASTPEGVVDALRDEVRSAPTESIDALRDRVARLLAMDAPSKGLRDDISDVDTQLAALTATAADTQDNLYKRRVRLQAELFRVQASASRSAAYTALAQTDPEHADQLRDLARTSARSAGDENKVKKELASVDKQLFAGAPLTTSNEDTAAKTETRRLKKKRRDLYAQVDETDQTWRNSAQLIARTESTNVLNEATLQSGLDREADSGERFVKTWIASLDERVRPTHGAPPIGCHGQTVLLREKFTVGGAAMDRPGDPEGPAEEVIQCRCAMTILTEDEHEQIAATLTAATNHQGDDDVTTQALERAATGTELSALPPLMWHGILTVEGSYTGDTRKFTDGSLRVAPLPLPMRFVGADIGAHDGAVVTANIEGVRRFERRIRAWGTFADGSLEPEVDKLQGLMATRMMRGISIDADDILDSQYSVEIDADGNLFSVFESARLRSATMVAIPAYHEAEVFLGPPPAEWLLEGEPLVEGLQDPDTVPVDLEDLDALVADVSMPQQTAEYWLPGGEGAESIGWGSDGDMPRCRAQLSLWAPHGTTSAVCSNLYYRALGAWPGTGILPGLVAAVEGVTFTAADFEPFTATGPTPLTITDDGRVFGHVAAWGTCHTGYTDTCVTPPSSSTGYALFHTGGIRLDDGTVLPIGKLTVSGGHADTRWGVAASKAHYDDSTTAACVVRASEDEYGIQVSGRVIPGTSQEKIDELLRSPLSGDWRPYGNGLELIAAHGVNSPGFPVVRAMVATVGGRQTALLSAGMLPVEDRPSYKAQAAMIAASLPPRSPREIKAAADEIAAQLNPI